MTKFVRTVTFCGDLKTRLCGDSDVERRMRAPEEHGRRLAANLTTSPILRRVFGKHGLAIGLDDAGLHR